MTPPDWLRSPDINLDDAIISLDAEGNVVALNEEAFRLGLDGDPHGRPLEATFPIRDEFSGREPTGLSRSVVLPSRAGELRAFDLLVVPLSMGRGWTVVLRPAIASGDVEHEAWANLSKESKEGTGLGDPSTGTLGLVSESFAKLHGYHPEEMLGMPVAHIFPDDSHGVQVMEERLRAGAVSWEALHRRKDGSIFPVRLSVTTIRDPLGQARFRAMRIEDISARRDAEEREKAGRLLLRRVVDTVPSIVYLIHPIKGEMRFLSREVAGALGYLPEAGPAPGTESVDARFTSESLHPEDYPGMLAYRARLPRLADGETATFEYRIRTATGGWAWFLSRDTVFEREPDGRVKTILGTATDVTEVRAREANADFLDAFSRAASRLEEPEAILATVGERLGAYLDVDSVAFVELDESREREIEVVGFSGRDDAINLKGSHRIGEFFPDAAFMGAMRAGETWIVRDATREPHVDAEAYASIGVRSYVAIPLHREGTGTHVLTLSASDARDWRPDEISLIKEVAQRVFPWVERARAETDLRASETRLKTVIDALPVAVSVMNAEGQTQTSNAEMSRYLPKGVMPSLDAERGWRWRAWDADGRPILRSEFPGARALRGESTAPGIEMLYTRDDGTEIWTRVASVPLLDRDGGLTSAFTVITDIDALKRTADALRQSEQRFRSLFQSIDEGYALVELLRDESGVARDYRYLEANPIAEHQAGIVGLVGHTACELFPGLDDEWVRLYARVADTGESLRFEKEFGERWYTIFISRVGGGGSPFLATISNDVTDRRRREAQT